MGRKEDMKFLKDFKKRLLKKIDVEKMILFGSRAWGDIRDDSDFDLVIVSKDFEGKKSRKRAREVYDYWDLDYAVDFLCYTPEEFEKLSKRVSIVSQAVEEGIEI